MRGRRVRDAGVVALSLLLASACGSSTKPTALKTDSPSPTAPTPATASPTPTWSTTQQAIITAYTGFWTALPKASRAQSRDDRLKILFPYTTTPELSQLIAKLSDQLSKGQALYGVNVPRVQHVDVSDSRATIQDCQQSSAAGVEDVSTHRKVTVGVDRHPVTATLLLRGTDWKVSVVSYGPDGAKC
jgi:hypothetical protein